MAAQYMDPQGVAIRATVNVTGWPKGHGSHIRALLEKPSDNPCICPPLVLLSRMLTVAHIKAAVLVARSLHYRKLSLWGARDLGRKSGT